MIAVNLYKKKFTLFFASVQQVHFPCQVRPSGGNVNIYTSILDIKISACD